MLRVSPVPAFADNYIWVLHDSTHALVVDPGDAAPVQAFLAEHQLTLAGVLITLFDDHGHRLAGTTSDARGGFLFEHLAIGSYQVGAANLPDDTPYEVKVARLQQLQAAIEAHALSTHGRKRQLPKTGIAQQVIHTALPNSLAI